MRFPSVFAFLATALTCSASVIPSGYAYTKTVQGRAVTVTEGDLDNFAFYAQYSAASYCNDAATSGANVTCSNDGCPAVEANGAQILRSLNQDTSTNIAGYLALDSKRKNIVLALRGSTSVRNWITNLTFIWSSCSFVTDCKLHTGFAKAWSQIQTDVLATIASAKAQNPDYTVVVTGHSLGGAVATIAGVYLRQAGYPVEVYTYGSPRVGNQEFVQWEATQTGNVEYRVTHIDDPVPRLPPIFLGYRHVTPEYWLNGGSSSTINYTVADIKVCEGFANINCNGGSLGLDTDAHLYYLTNMLACGSDKLVFRRDDANSISDAELEQRLNLYAQMDREFVNALEANNTIA
ncbi:hypothetical protein MCOR25_004010 [Pyricularia grisea]|uniref:Fungal lipase-like domain-containing protein n=1 Tax=Pyricularia grisea TaxID=148305 RepID=A0A6P8B6J0_PYRGI|nr:hypothetical protein PgNI_06107 [Pyricularia grisea]KAI6371238.1 hypothetical protein MCOR25_004010 [Pyricularia grisea]TLD10880.1 hypothetical protein PgNI_06107 [Pyricularia grisea]